MELGREAFDLAGVLFDLPAEPCGLELLLLKLRREVCDLVGVLFKLFPEPFGLQFLLLRPRGEVPDLGGVLVKLCAELGSSSVGRRDFQLGGVEALPQLHCLRTLLLRSSLESGHPLC